MFRSLGLFDSLWLRLGFFMMYGALLLALFNPDQIFIAFIIEMIGAIVYKLERKRL